MLIAGWALFSAIYLAFALAVTGWQVWLIFLTYGFVYSLTETARNAMVTRLGPSERKGLAFGWFNFAIGVAALPASLVCGWLYQNFGALAAFGWGAILAAIAALLLLFI